jgi:hypothetical protein
MVFMPSTKHRYEAGYQDMTTFVHIAATSLFTDNPTIAQFCSLSYNVINPSVLAAANYLHANMGGSVTLTL